MAAPALKPVVVTFIKGNIVTPEAVLYGSWLEVTDDTISRIGAAGQRIPTADEKQEQLRAERGALVCVTINTIEGAFLLPGFVDIHNHGAGGAADVVEFWTNPEFSQRLLAKCGTLSTLASIIFSTKKGSVDAVIASVEATVGKVLPDCCVIEGIHAEGPIISDYGGLPTTNTDLSLEEFKTLCATMPSMKIMTIAPSKEARVGYERLRHLLDLGVRPSLGHDRRATSAEILGALQQQPRFLRQRRSEAATAKAGQAPSKATAPPATGNGASPLGKSTAAADAPPRTANPTSVGDEAEATRMHSTHMFNVMSFHHREPGLVNYVLCRGYPQERRYEGCAPPTTEIIADLIHCHPVAVQMVLSAKDSGDVAVISDCISVHEPGRRLKYNGRNIAVQAEGGCYLCDEQGRPTPTLAGSTVTLADEFLTLVTHFGVPLVTACRMLATTPARIAKINHVGALEVGRKANVLLVNNELNTIERRMVYGRMVEADRYRMLKPAVAHL